MNKEARYSVVNGQNALTANGRFCVMAAASPQKGQWELGSSYPAASAVKPPPRKAASTLAASTGDAVAKTRKQDTKRLTASGFTLNKNRNN